jgi:hypothetical protein
MMLSEGGDTVNKFPDKIKIGEAKNYMKSYRN